MRLLILVLSILSSSQLFAQVAKVSALSGQATIERAEQSIAANIGSAILQKDIIKTQNNSRLQLVFNDKTVITLGKNTVFSVQNYLFDDTAESEVNFSLTKGFLKSVTGKIGKIAPKRFQIKTKTSTIGIRGTIFTVEVNSQFTRLTTINGTTYFIDNQTGKEYVVVKNQQLTYEQATKKIELKQVNLTTKEPEPGRSNAYHEVDNNEQQATESEQTAAINENSADNSESSTQKVVAGSGDYARYGYWEDSDTKEMTEVFAENMPGEEITSSDVINELIINSSQATYDGDLIAFDGNKNKGVGSIRMNVSFGGTPAVTGSMEYSINGVDWNNDFEGEIDADTSSFKVDRFTPMADSDVNDPTGEMNGNFYGPLAEETAGTFELRGENASTGVVVQSTGSFVGISSGSAP